MDQGKNNKQKIIPVALWQTAWYNPARVNPSQASIRKEVKYETSGSQATRISRRHADSTFVSVTTSFIVQGRQQPVGCAKICCKTVAIAFRASRGVDSDLRKLLY
jgi:hypothetical protein